MAGESKQHDGDVFDFINTFANTDQKRSDSIELVKLMQKVSNYPPKMWGAHDYRFRQLSLCVGTQRLKEIGLWWAFPHARRQSLFMYTQGVPITNICSKTWANSRWERHVSM